MITLLLYALLGVFAGLIAGLFGVGGGVVLVPALIFSFAKLGLASEYLTHMAVGTSLAIICVTSISSVKAHHDNGFVQWNIFKPLAPGLIVGAILGVYLIRFVQGDLLQLIIGIFLCLVSVQMGFSLMPEGRRALPNGAALSGFGSVIGVVSAIFGIGGGSLTVPLLSHYGVKMQHAVATSAACGVPIAIFATLANAVSAIGQTEEIPYAIGFIYLPAFVGVAVMSAPSAKVGAMLAKNLDARKLKRLFAVFLVIIGSLMISKGTGLL